MRIFHRLTLARAARHGGRLHGGANHKTGSEMREAEPQGGVGGRGRRERWEVRDVEEKKPRRWWARLGKRRIFGCLLILGYLHVTFIQYDNYHNAASLEEKLDAIFIVINSIWIIGVCLWVYLDSLLNEPRERQQPKSQKDFSG